MTDPHGAEPYGRLVSVAKIAYLFCDFTLGWLLRIRPFVQRGGLVIVERGWWDMAVDPKRYRLDLPAAIYTFLGRLQSHGDLLLVLDAPVDVLVRRKAELPRAEIERQTRSWRDRHGARSVTAFLDASRGIEDLVADARREIEARLR
ncbi:MAG: hypothetical protein AABM32_02440 [Chloroflexota bacterium]